jgi:hypothetical protein
VELTVRYTGSWFRPDVVLLAVYSCFFGLGLWYAALPFLRSPHLFGTGAAILPALLVLIVAFMVFSTARSLITVGRFRLQIDAHSVSYRRMFRESTYTHDQIGVLRWEPRQRRTPDYLVFKNPGGDALFSILGSLLSTTQLHQISEALHKPVLDLPDVGKSGQRYRSE